jgi:hypothetical protein
MNIINKLDKAVLLQCTRFCYHCGVNGDKNGVCPECKSDDLAFEFRGEHSYNIEDFHSDILLAANGFKRSAIKERVDEKIKAVLPKTNGHIDLGDCAYDLDELVRRAYPDDYEYMVDNEETRMIEDGEIVRLRGFLYETDHINEVLDKILENLSKKAA